MNITFGKPVLVVAPCKGIVGVNAWLRLSVCKCKQENHEIGVLFTGSSYFLNEIRGLVFESRTHFEFSVVRISGKK